MTFLTECIEDSQCSGTYKNKCNSDTNKCECNVGFDLENGNCVCMAGEIDVNGMCNPCQNNEFVNTDGKCIECPAGQEPMADRKSCVKCPSDKISTNGICMMCSDPTQVPNSAMTNCVECTESTHCTDSAKPVCDINVNVCVGKFQY